MTLFKINLSKKLTTMFLHALFEYESNIREVSPILLLNLTFLLSSEQMSVA